MEPISQVVYKILRKIGLNPSDIRSEKNFRDELGMESIEILYMTNLLENKFKILIPDKDINRLESPVTTIRYIQNKLQYN